MITQQQLWAALDYEPESGVFTWKVSFSNRKPVGSYAGGLGARGYRHIDIYGVRYPAHRLAWLYVYGEWPKGVVDHIDGNPSNNGIENLRDVSQQLNTRNCKLSKNSRSGVNGVNWSTAANRWTAFIMVNGKSKNLGTFDTISQAASARKAAEAGLGFISR